MSNRDTDGVYLIHTKANRYTTENDEVDTNPLTLELFRGVKAREDAIAAFKALLLTTLESTLTKSTSSWTMKDFESAGVHCFSLNAHRPTGHVSVDLDANSHQIDVVTKTDGSYDLVYTCAMLALENKAFKADLATLRAREEEEEVGDTDEEEDEEEEVDDEDEAFINNGEVDYETQVARDAAVNEESSSSSSSSSEDNDDEAPILTRKQLKASAKQQEVLEELEEILADPISPTRGPRKRRERSEPRKEKMSKRQHQEVEEDDDEDDPSYSEGDEEEEEHIEIRHSPRRSIIRVSA